MLPNATAPRCCALTFLLLCFGLTATILMRGCNDCGGLMRPVHAARKEA